MSLAEKPWFRKFLVSAAGKPHLKKFEAASRDLRATQESLVMKIVAECRETAYGKDHGFDKIATVDDYRRAVPTGDFERHRPYVERMMQGDADILFPGRPIIYNTTSGTTDKAKMIPISKAGFEEGISGLNRLWLYTCMRDNPHIYDGKSLSAVAAAETGTVADGTPYGSISGLSYRSIPGVLKSTYSFPYPVVCIEDYQHKYYAMMRFALDANITFIICPSPSNMVRLHQTAVDFFSDLVRDIRDGALRADVADGLPPADRAGVLAQLAPNPRRAKELESLMNAHGADLRPKHYWPDVACINIWKQGNFSLLVPKLDGYFPEKTVFRAFGYQASEGRAGLVLDNAWDFSALSAHTYHFEFIEESARDAANPRTLLAHEVERGGRYFILFTNGSGLYRYDINDLVEIVGFYNQVPLFRFIQKGEGVTSLTGEKLTEIQVIQAISSAARERGIGARSSFMVCDNREFVYKLFVEFDPGVPDNDRSALAGLVDARLREINPEYEIKRGSGRLAAPRAFELRADSHELLKQELISRKLTTAGQYKDLYLTTRPVVLEILEKLTIKR